ncbi:MAG: endonuclease/exonuclease/phosphatase family protein [Acidobacteria bacterium]|nr:endonuclease/exonuclease/phosphatase family protein [Acidobacteriota bacterium]
MKPLRVASVLTIVACLAGAALRADPGEPGRSAAGAPAKPAAARPAVSGPGLLSWAELDVLGRCGESYPPGLKARMDKILETPFRGGAIRRPAAPKSSPELGPFVRAAMWNIERGLNFDAVAAALADPGKLAALLDPKECPPGSAARREALEQAALLREADILVLNEADWGMKRTKYRFVAEDLARLLGMEFAYAVEFLEVDPIALGTETFEGMDSAERERLRREIAVDRSRYRGLHGTAVLSRFPIRKAEILRLPQVYDWYAGEKRPVSLPEKAKRSTSEKVFLETVLREVRRGGRNCLRVDLEVAGLPGKTVTVLATHLENKCKPEKRRSQVYSLLTHYLDIPHPVILAGDMNTTGSDGTPTSISREVKRRVGSAEFWTTQGVKYATGVGILFDLISGGVRLLKNQYDPTSRHVPVFAPNPEAAFFDTLRDMRFDDGGAFDFRGDAGRTVNGTAGKLANSNMRQGKGFVPTFEVERTIGALGRLKLDWFFVKGFARDPDRAAEPYRFAPHFPRTLKALNEAVPEDISDHCPITVDLPLAEPGSLVP